jgi:hypothetical protein
MGYPDAKDAENARQLGIVALVDKSLIIKEPHGRAGQPEGPVAATLLPVTQPPRSTHEVAGILHLFSQLASTRP